ncbi:hypothetical protein TIFTF001_014037 [Ficus carica]|uniref:Uncharacterized protein n=1 Tax=Ficus carica TaxID=3494 RepID=A0AA88AIX9_FICCA|nr:hypothetical protein TIFTF001_014037 [Ficus carica]
MWGIMGGGRGKDRGKRKRQREKRVSRAIPSIHYGKSNQQANGGGQDRNYTVPPLLFAGGYRDNSRRLLLLSCFLFDDDFREIGLPLRRRRVATATLSVVGIGLGI